MLDVVLRRLAVAFHARVASSAQIRAADEPAARSGAESPLRVLLVGSGITTGWGVQTYGLALVGSLQRSLQSRLGRPVDVVQVSGFGTPIAQASHVVGPSAAEPWDAVVVAFGLSDAFLLTPVPEWTRGLDRLLAKLDADMPAGRLVPITVVGIPPMDSLRAARPFSTLLQRHAERLNAASRAATARNRRAAFAGLPELADRELRPDGSPAAYRQWAEVIADVTAPRLAVADGPVPASCTSAVTAADPRPTDPSPVPDGRTRGSRRLPRRGRVLQAGGEDLVAIARRRPAPRDAVVRFPGPDPIRVLTIGGEYSIGFGAGCRAAALDGALARLLHTRTGRGVEVENRAQDGLRLAHLAGSMGPVGARGFDLVLWTPTFAEAAKALRRSRWLDGLDPMLQRIAGTSDAAVLLVGFPLLLGAQPLAVLGRARAQQLNRLLRRIALRHRRTAVVEPPPVVLQDVTTVDSSAVYLDAAIELLPAALRLLRAPASSDRALVDA